MAAKATHIRGAVGAGPDFAPLAYAADIAIKGMNMDVAPNGIGPSGRAGRCSL